MERVHVYFISSFMRKSFLPSFLLSIMKIFHSAEIRVKRGLHSAAVRMVGNSFLLRPMESCWCQLGALGPALCNSFHLSSSYML